MKAYPAAGLAVVATAGIAASHSPAQTRAAIAKALADPARADAAKDDTRRKAAEVLAFSGVGPGDVVVDYLPGGAAYWTRIFTNVVGPKGKVTALWNANPSENAKKAIATVTAMNLPNVTAMGADMSTVGSVDLVWTVQNYHDIANRGGETALLELDRKIYNALKPGGTYVVIDHAAAPGSGLSATNTLHRIDPASVKATVEKAGFRFAGELKVLRNPADDHSKGVTDPAIRGMTDQFVYKFVKR